MVDSGGLKDREEEGIKLDGKVYEESLVYEEEK